MSCTITFFRILIVMNTRVKNSHFNINLTSIDFMSSIIVSNALANIFSVGVVFFDACILHRSNIKSASMFHHTSIAVIPIAFWALFYILRSITHHTLITTSSIHTYAHFLRFINLPRPSRNQSFHLRYSISLIISSSLCNK